MIVEKKYLTMQEYIDCAEALINKYTVKHTKNPDMIAYVMEYLMRADSKYNPEIGCQDGFRVYYGRCGILNWINRKENKQFICEHSLDFCFKSDEKSLPLKETIISDKYNTESTVLASEIVEIIKKSNKITEEQRTAILGYYINKNKLKDIASDLGTNISKVRYYIKTGLEKIRYEAGYNEHC